MKITGSRASALLAMAALAVSLYRIADQNVEHVNSYPVD